MFTIKKSFLQLFIFFHIGMIFAIDLSMLEGSWMPIRGNIDYLYSEAKTNNFEKNGEYKINPYSYVLLEIKEQPINGRTDFLSIYNGTFYIDKIKWIEKEKKIILDCRYFRYEYDPVDNTYKFNESSVIDKLEIEYVDEDELKILNFDGFQGWTKYYRISGPAKIPVQNAVINDSNVRLRVKPNLECETWTKLQKGTKVKIKDKSAKPMEIDGESWYWYRVDAENLPDGWVYGKYLDIEEYAEED